MKTPLPAKLLTILTLALLAQTAAALITIETVPVGNAGNAADPTTGYGAVGYDYRMGKYEVTLHQYTVFLNAVAVADYYGLYNAKMQSEPNIAGIARQGSFGSYSYSVIGSGLRPVTYVSWFDAARFVNWLENGQPSGAMAAGSTETGAYTLNGRFFGVVTRNAQATYGLPTEDEWYKAAYHQPASQGGDSDGYWRYPTGSNATPNSRNGSSGDGNSGNFYRNDGLVNGFNGGYAVNDSLVFPTGNALTDAGAFSLADSFYGTFDQGGNLWEWNDAIIGGTARGMRGGSWNNAVNFLEPTPRTAGRDPANELSADLGFRIVIVPEPSVVGIVALGMALVAWKRK